MMDWATAKDALDVLDHLASIATAGIAAVAFGGFTLRKRVRRQALENYLAGEAPRKRFGADTGQRSIIHLVAALRMSEAEILDAAFNSRKVKVLRTQDPITGRSDGILLQHVNLPNS